MRNLKWFDSLQRRDFDNGAVIAEIRDVFKAMDECRAHNKAPWIAVCQQCGEILDDNCAQWCERCSSERR